MRVRGGMKLAKCAFRAEMVRNDVEVAAQHPFHRTAHGRGALIEDGVLGLVIDEPERREIDKSAQKRRLALCKRKTRAP